MRPDFEVTVRVRNNHLKSRRDELGFSQKDMAAILGVGGSTYAQFESMRTSPISTKGHWKGVPLALASFFNVMPEELFPDEVMSVTTPVVVRKVFADELIAITNGSSRLCLPASAAYDATELSEQLSEALHTLTPREQKVMRMRFHDDLTIEAVGCELFITRERARQIEMKALRKLRHPSRSKALRAFADDVRR